MLCHEKGSLHSQVSLECGLCKLPVGTWTWVHTTTMTWNLSIKSSCSCSSHSNGETLIPLQRLKRYDLVIEIRLLTTTINEHVQGCGIWLELGSCCFDTALIGVVDLDYLRSRFFELLYIDQPWTERGGRSIPLTSPIEGSFSANVSGRTEPIVFHCLALKVLMSWRPIPRFAPWIMAISGDVIAKDRGEDSLLTNNQNCLGHFAGEAVKGRLEG